MLKRYFTPKILLPVILIFLPFTTYLITMPRSILWIDSGTMIAASYTLGIPNPPGFPFYMLASHFFAILPIFNVLTRLELFSIIFSILAIQLIYRIIVLIIDSDLYFFKQSKQDQSLKNSKDNSNLKYFAGFFGAISLAFSYQYWSQSQNTEAFIFTDFFLCLFIYILLLVQSKKALFLSQVNQKKGSFSQYLFKKLLLLAFLYGLAAGANPTIAVLVPGVIFVMLLNKKFLSFKKILVLGIIFFATLVIVYSYLPVRASTWPFVNWGNPQTLQLFIGHLRGEGLNIYEPQSGSINGFTGSPIVFFKSLSRFFYLFLIQFTPFLLPFIFLGLNFVFRKNKYLFLFLISVPIVNVFYAGLYFSGNQESWFILSWVICAIFMGLGFYFLSLKFSSKKIYLRIVLLLCFLPLIFWFIPLNRSQHYYSKDYAINLYSSLDKNAILIGMGDFTNSLGYYLHEADKYREDVTPLTANTFYVNRWYRDSLRHSSNIIVSPKLEQIIKYKEFDEYNRAMNEFIADNIDNHPIYVTHLTLRASAIANSTAGQLVLDSRFKFIPHGLSLQVVRSDLNVKPDFKAFDFVFKSKNPQKAPFYLEKNYTDGYKNLANDYAYSWEALGDWYFDSKNYEKAFEYYKKAELWSPNNPEIISRFGQYYGSINKLDIARQYFQKTLDLSPSDLLVRYNLAFTLARMGRSDEALQQYEAIENYAAGSQIALEAKKQKEALLNIPNQTFLLKNEVYESGSTFINKEDNYSFMYPKGWSVVKNEQGLVYVTNGETGKQALNLVIYGKQIIIPQRIDDFVKSGPLKQNGTLLNIQNVNTPGGLKIFLQSWGENGKYSQIVVITNDLWAWQIAVSPSDSVKMEELYKIISTFKPLR